MMSSNHLCVCIHFIGRKLGAKKFLSNNNKKKTINSSILSFITSFSFRLPEKKHINGHGQSPSFCKNTICTLILWVYVEWSERKNNEKIKLFMRNHKIDKDIKLSWAIVPIAHWSNFINSISRGFLLFWAPCKK